MEIHPPFPSYQDGDVFRGGHRSELHADRGPARQPWRWNSQLENGKMPGKCLENGKMPRNLMLIDTYCGRNLEPVGNYWLWHTGTWHHTGTKHLIGTCLGIYGAKMKVPSSKTRWMSILSRLKRWNPWWLSDPLFLEAPNSELWRIVLNPIVVQNFKLEQY